MFVGWGWSATLRRKGGKTPITDPRICLVCSLSDQPSNEVSFAFSTLYFFFSFIFQNIICHFSDYARGIRRYIVVARHVVKSIVFVMKNFNKSDINKYMRYFQNFCHFYIKKLTQVLISPNHLTRENLKVRPFGIDKKMRNHHVQKMFFCFTKLDEYIF